MKIIKDYPPNFEDIRSLIPITEDTIYCYGDSIFNPSGKEIPQDIFFHELVHAKQQGKNPEGWWQKYLYSESFRLNQELEAYSEQLSFIKKNFTAKGQKLLLDEMADNLSRLYSLRLTFSEAHTIIRKYKKNA